jgi:hypothetical protein
MSLMSVICKNTTDRNSDQNMDCDLTLMRVIKYFHKKHNSLASIRLFRIMSTPITFRLFRVMTSEMLGRIPPVFTLLFSQRQPNIVVDAVDYK